MARIIDRWTLTNREIDNTNTFLILATIAGGKAREGDCSACSVCSVVVSRRREARPRHEHTAATEQRHNFPI